MASHDNFGLWQHLRFLIPKRNWVKPSLFIAGFGKGVAERAKEWEEVGWRKLLLESVFSHPPNSPSFILVTSLMNTPKTTPHYRAVSIPSLSSPRQWIEEETRIPRGGSREPNRFHPWPNTYWPCPRSKCTICLSPASYPPAPSKGKRAENGDGGRRIEKGRGKNRKREGKRDSATAGKKVARERKREESRN